MALVSYLEDILRRLDEARHDLAGSSRSSDDVKRIEEKVSALNTLVDRLRAHIEWMLDQLTTPGMPPLEVDLGEFLRLRAREKALLADIADRDAEIAGLRKGLREAEATREIALGQMKVAQEQNEFLRAFGADELLMAPNGQRKRPARRR